MPRKICFIVDGHAEMLIFQWICGTDAKILRSNCNGKAVSIQTLIKTYKALIDSNKNLDPVIIILDREDRKESSEEIKNLILSELKRIFTSKDIHIGVPDKMFENWILADPAGINPLLDREIPITITSHEGRDGKNILKQYKDGYKETTDGLELFKKIDPCVLKVNSPSFSAFSVHPELLRYRWFKKLTSC